MKKVLVAGLGNPLMGDEGIGPALVGELSAGADRFPDVEFVDLGTAGLGVLHAIAGRRKAVLVDCAFMGMEPGAIRRFSPADVRSTKARLATTSHAPDLLETVELSRALGECPDQVVIFGIQPERVAPGEPLSPALRARFQEYLGLIAAELTGPAGAEPPASR